MNGFGVVSGAHFKGVVVVDEPRFRFVSEGQHALPCEVPNQGVPRPCINGRLKIEMESEF